LQLPAPYIENDETHQQGYSHHAADAQTDGERVAVGGVDVKRLVAHLMCLIPSFDDGVVSDNACLTRSTTCKP
jgi:hypothetical protein